MEINVNILKIFLSKIIKYLIKVKKNETINLLKVRFVYFGFGQNGRSLIQMY